MKKSMFVAFTFTIYYDLSQPAGNCSNDFDGCRTLHFRTAGLWHLRLNSICMAPSCTVLEAFCIAKSDCLRHQTSLFDGQIYAESWTLKRLDFKWLSQVGYGLYMAVAPFLNCWFLRQWLWWVLITCDDCRNIITIETDLWCDTLWVQDSVQTVWIRQVAGAKFFKHRGPRACRCWQQSFVLYLYR